MVVKKAERIPSELLPLVIFDEILWLSLFCAGILIGIVWSLLRYVNNIMSRPSDVIDKVEFYIDNYKFSRFVAHQSQMRQYVQVFVDSWLLFLSIPMRRFTRIQNERIFIASVCLVSMIFVSMYQSGLSTVFVEPLYFKDINSLEQLDRSGAIINVKYAGYLTDVFLNDSSGTITNLHYKMKLLETEMSAMEIVINFKKTATITRKSTVSLDNSIYFINKQLHLIEKECPKNYFLAYMVPTHSLYIERINEILFDIQRFGFIMKWINEINFQATMNNMKSFNVEEKSIVLSFDDLKFPFIVLMTGSSLGISVLAIESLIHFTRTRQKCIRYSVSNKT